MPTRDELIVDLAQKQTLVDAAMATAAAAEARAGRFANACSAANSAAADVTRLGLDADTIAATVAVYNRLLSQKASADAALSTARADLAAKTDALNAARAALE